MTRSADIVHHLDLQVKPSGVQSIELRRLVDRSSVAGDKYPLAGVIRIKSSNRTFSLYRLWRVWFIRSMSSMKTRLYRSSRVFGCAGWAPSCSRRGGRVRCFSLGSSTFSAATTSTLPDQNSGVACTLLPKRLAQFFDQGKILDDENCLRLWSPHHCRGYLEDVSGKCSP